ncbi:MAG: diguanylate cyclase [Anaerolineales bacterium]
MTNHGFLRSLKSQVFGYGVVVALVALSTTGYINYRLAESQARELVHEHLLEDAMELADTLAGHRTDEVQSLIADSHGVNGGHDVFLVDASGQVVAALDPVHIGQPATALMSSTSEVERVLSGVDPMAQSSMTHDGERFLTVSVPVFGDPANPARITAVLRYSEPYSELEVVVGRTLEVFLLSTGLLLLLLIAPLVLYLERTVLRPARLLVDTGEAVAAGRWEEAILSEAALPRHEMGELVRSHNRMLNSLRAQQQQLRRETRHARTLEQVAGVLNQAMQLGEPLEPGLRAVMELVQAEAGWITLSDSADRWRLVVALGLPPALEADDRAALRWPGCACQRMLLAGGLPGAANIIQCERLRQAPGDTNGLRYHASVPIRARDNTLGLLSLTTPPERVFDENELQLLAAVGHQFGVAIERTQLFESEQRRRAAGAALLDIARVASSSLKPSQVLKQITRRTAAVCGAERCSVLLLDEAGTRLRPVMAQFADGHEDMAQWETFKSRASQSVDDLPFFRAVIHEQRALVISASDSDTALVQWIQPFGIEMLLAVPLVSREGVIGLLALDTTEVEPGFSPEQIELAQTIGAQITGAITNAQLYAEVERRAQELEALRATATDISAELKLPDLLRAILDRAIPLLGASGGELAIYDAERDDLEIVAAQTLGVEQVAMRMALGEGAMGQAAATREPIIIDDYHAWSGRSGQYTGVQFHATLAVPLLSRGQLLGVIGVVRAEPEQKFTPADLQLLTLFAQQATIAVENARLFGEVERLAITDGLTGLHNRRHFLALAEREFERALRYKRPLSILMLDIDHFKKVNDTYGHAAGDQVLRAVATRARQSLREVDFVGRYGGEEFTAALLEVPLPAACVAAGRMVQGIADQPFETEHGPIRVTVSVGAASLAPDDTALSELLARADEAMYRAKRRGRNQVCSLPEDEAFR